MQTRMPVVFIGHGSPMLALEDSEESRTLSRLGAEIEEKFGGPKGILAISGHWFTRGTWVQNSAHPRQVYDMYGFPQELYEIVYPASGDAALASEVARLLGARTTEEHGIDHGVWSVLVHMFPRADIPVVALSVDGTIPPRAAYQLGQRLTPLRDKGILILATGAIVHNLRDINPADVSGSPQTNAFRSAVRDRVEQRDDEALIGFSQLPGAAYAVPTPDHYLPLLYGLGASEGEGARVFNDVPQFGSTALTSFIFGLDSKAAPHT